MTEAKLYFAPVPARAFGDDRLTHLHLRVLGVVAMHDRMSGRGGKGQGCWAGNMTLARKSNCHITNLSTALTELGRFGYIHSDPHPLNRRLRVYRVIYTPEDEAFVRSAKDDNRLPTGKGLNRDSLPADPSTLCPIQKKSVTNQGDDAIEYIPRSGEYIPPKRIINSTEVALSKKERVLSRVPTSPSGRLAFYERQLKNNVPLALQHVLDDLTEIQDAAEGGSAIYGWADRLMADVSELIERAA